MLLPHFPPTTCPLPTEHWNSCFPLCLAFRLYDSHAPKISLPLFGSLWFWIVCTLMALHEAHVSLLPCDHVCSRSHLIPGTFEGTTRSKNNLFSGISYKYIGPWLDSKLDWTTHTNHLYRKGQSRASINFYTMVCWGGGICKKDTFKLETLLRWTSSLDSGREENFGQTAGHHGQSRSPSAHCHYQLEEPVYGLLTM